GRQDFVRVRSEPEYRQDVAVLEDEDSDDVYLVRPDIYPYIKEECRLVTIFTAISRKGDVFLWAIPLPDADGKDNDWNRTNRDAALRAMKEWVAVRSNRSIGAYVVGVAQIHIPDPEWGETPPLARGCIPNLAAVLFRGHYMAAVSAMVHASAPLDTATLD